MSGHCSNCGTVLLYGTRHLNCPGLFAAATPQPAPVLREGVDVQSLVIADVEARREMGIAKYGTPLQAHNGRDALMDAYQEALDLTHDPYAATAVRAYAAACAATHPQLSAALLAKVGQP